MRKVVVLEFMTLDGVIQAGGGPEEDRSGGFAYGGWMAPYDDERLGAAMQAQLEEPCDLLLGRTTFEIWAAYWPEHGDFWPRVNTATKYVASTTLTTHAWQPSVFLNGDVPAQVAALKGQPGPDLHVYGSAKLVQTLLAHDLVDELRLKTFPLTLGTGKRLFAEGTRPAAFTMTAGAITPSGILLATYARAGAVRTGRLG